MTRYREKTRRFLILYLNDAAAGASLKDIAKALDRDERVIKNYLRHFKEDFEVRGHAQGARWVTNKRIRLGKVVAKDIGSSS